MSSILANAADSITPPVQGKNLYVLDLTTSSQAIRIPDGWANRYLTIVPRGADAYFAFKYGGTFTVDETAKSTIASNTVPVTTNGAASVPNGGQRNVDLRNTKTSHDPALAPSVQVTAEQLWFAWKGSAAGVLEITVSDGIVLP